MNNFIGWKQLQNKLEYNKPVSLKEYLLITLVVIVILIAGSEEFASLIINLF